MPQLAQQLAVVLADAGSIGIELERPLERPLRHRQAPEAVRHRGEGAERERIVRVDSRDLLHVLERARQARTLGRGRRLQAVVQLDVRPRIGQARIVERPAAAGSGRVAEASQPRFLLGRGRIRLRAIALGGDALERAPQLVASSGRRAPVPGAARLRRLARILREVVELRLAADDQLPVVLHPGAQRRPVAVQAAEQALAVQRVRRTRCRSPSAAADRGRAAQGRRGFRAGRARLAARRLSRRAAAPPCLGAPRGRPSATESSSSTGRRARRASTRRARRALRRDRRAPRPWCRRRDASIAASRSRGRSARR